MYAGMTFRHGSGRIVGTHQKVDRIARRHLKKYIPASVHFPGIEAILHFEGKNGPDGLKLKSPYVDEPWHFIDPNDPSDKKLLVDIDDHIFNLAVALRNKDNVRAAFEAAWLAHAVVDGLTPAHHYPINDKIEELWGTSHDERETKLLIHGSSHRETISKTWEYWGAKGVMTTHLGFEFGAASAASTEKFKQFVLSPIDIEQLPERGFESVFMEALHLIDSRHMYDKLYKKGWTEELAREVREILVPQMIRAVALAWYQAILDSQKEE